MNETDIISKVVEHGPAIAFLVWMVIYFKSQLKEKDKAITNLNKELRESEKETINYLKDLANSLDKLYEKI